MTSHSILNYQVHPVIVFMGQLYSWDSTNLMSAYPIAAQQIQCCIVAQYCTYVYAYFVVVGLSIDRVVVFGGVVLYIEHECYCGNRLLYLWGCCIQWVIIVLSLRYSDTQYCKTSAVGTVKTISYKVLYSCYISIHDHAYNRNITPYR